MNMRSVNRYPFGRVDVFVVFLLIMLVAVQFCRNNLYYPVEGDEFFTYFPVVSNNLVSMIDNSNHINATPPVYFVLCYVWKVCFGDSITVLRSLTFFCFCGASVSLYILMRSYFSVFSSMISTVLVFSSYIVVGQIHCMRFYGLYFLLSLFATSYSVAQWKVNHKSTLAFNFKVFVCHFLLISTHSIGLLYSGCLLLVCFIKTFTSEKKDGMRLVKSLARSLEFDKGMILAIGFSWLLFFLLWFKQVQKAGEWFDKSSSFLQKPGISDLVREILVQKWIAIFFISLLILNLFLLIRNREIFSERLNRSFVVILISITFVLLPKISVFVLSLVSHPSFLNRYFIPSLIGIAILIAFMLDNILYVCKGYFYVVIRNFNANAKCISSYFVCFFAAIVLNFLVIGNESRKLLLDWSIKMVVPGSDIASYLESIDEYGEIPLVCQKWNYLQYYFYSVKPSRFYYLLRTRAAPSVGVLKQLEDYFEYLSHEDRVPCILPEDKFLAMHREFFYLGGADYLEDNTYFLRNEKFNVQIIRTEMTPSFGKGTVLLHVVVK